MVNVRMDTEAIRKRLAMARSVPLREGEEPGMVHWYVQDVNALLQRIAAVEEALEGRKEEK